jgi:predicted esterase
VRSYPAIAFFHGSNMSSSSYVHTIAGTWPELAEDYVLVGFDGERMNAWSEEGAPTYNFTYINFGGHEVGPAWAHRQSPALVAEGLDELREAYGLSQWFAGGHSQGGFLTYAIVMFYPEQLAGAFPMSCNLLVQCEPGNFEDEQVRRAQRAVALAPIHGENDDVVDFASGVYCHERMLDGGFPALRFFTHPRAGHMFALLPVEEAVRWLEALSSEDPEALVAFAEEAVAGERWRDVTAATARAARLDAEGALTSRIERARAAVDRAAEPLLRDLLPAAQANADGAWIDGFLAFRARFADADAAAEVMAVYARLRAEHEPLADELFWKQRGEEDVEQRDAMRRQIVERYYASSWYPLVKRWLAE